MPGERRGLSTLIRLATVGQPPVGWFFLNSTDLLESSPKGQDHAWCWGWSNQEEEGWSRAVEVRLVVAWRGVLGVATEGRTRRRMPC
jgi:hypothetical protein